MTSCKVILGFVLLSILYITYYTFDNNEIAWKSSDSSSYFFILLIFEYSDEIQCPHKRPYNAFILILNVYSLDIMF